MERKGRKHRGNDVDPEFSLVHLLPMGGHQLRHFWRHFCGHPEQGQYLVTYAGLRKIYARFIIHIDILATEAAKFIDWANPMAKGIYDRHHQEAGEALQERRDNRNLPMPANHRDHPSCLSRPKDGHLNQLMYFTLDSQPLSPCQCRKGIGCFSQYRRTLAFPPRRARKCLVNAADRLTC